MGKLSLKSFYYCRPRILILSTTLSAFSFFNVLYWYQYASPTNIASITFCFASVLCLIGTSILFMLHTMPFLNHSAKKTSALFMLFGSIFLFTACCLELSVDTHWCWGFTFCEIHLFAYHTVPFGASIMLSIDEFFDNMLFYNRRIRVSLHSLLLAVSAALFIPYYVELNRVAADGQIHIQLEFTQFHQLNVDINWAFIAVWALIGATSMLLLLVLGLCHLSIFETQRERPLHSVFDDLDAKRIEWSQSESTALSESQCTEYSTTAHGTLSEHSNVIPLICSLLICGGTAIVIMSYVVQNENAKYNAELKDYVGDVEHSANGLVLLNDDGVDFADPMICHHLLIAAVCWITSIDAMRHSHRSSSIYERL